MAPLTRTLLGWFLVNGAWVLAALIGYGLGCAYARNIFRAADKLAAAAGGKSGYYTVSAECGASKTKLGAVGRALIDSVFGQGHCVEAAKDEGLL